MARKILKKTEKEAGGSRNRREYIASNNKFIDPKLIEKLVEDYLQLCDINKVYSLYYDIYEFRNHIPAIEELLRDSKPTCPQLVIDALTFNLLEESPQDKMDVAPQYITAVIQAFHNLSVMSEVTVDLRDWPSRCYFGDYLESENKDLTVKLYGSLIHCGTSAKNCDFVLHQSETALKGCGAYAEGCRFTIFRQVENCGSSARHSSFYLYGGVEWCAILAKKCDFYLYAKVDKAGLLADGCTFNIGEGGDIGAYFGRFYNNTKRKMNDKGVWEIIR